MRGLGRVAIDGEIGLKAKDTSETIDSFAFRFRWALSMSTPESKPFSFK